MSKSINELVKEAFAANAPEEVRDGIALSNYVRNETLDRAYAVEGYATMSHERRNAIYEGKRSQVIAELRAAGIDW